jgi:plastocyanin domain-containing protein
MNKPLASLSSLAMLSMASAAHAEPTPIKVQLKDHRFSPSEILAPANTPVVIALTNADPTPEEFDSPALKVEKVVPGGQTGLVRIRPLAPGRYPFSGEYNAKTAQGVVVVK